MFRRKSEQPKHETTEETKHIHPTLRSKLVATYGQEEQRGLLKRSSTDDLVRPGTVLGKGTFGVVKLRHDKNTGQPYAVKTMDKPGHWDRERLVREALVLQNLDHPHIQRIFGWHDDTTSITMVIEFCAGGELLDAVSLCRGQGEVFRENWAAIMVKQMFEAIAYLHARALVHMDIKSGNILLLHAPEPDITFLFKTTPHVVVADLGLAIVLDPSTSWFKKKLAGDAKGTPATMAPEVWKGDIGPKNDVWSLGCILYELFCMRLPYLPDDLHDQSQKTWERLYKSAEANAKQELEVRDCSAEVKHLCLQLLTVDAKSRPQLKELLSNAWFERFIPQGQTALMEAAVMMCDMPSLCKALAKWPSLKPTMRAVCLKLASDARGTAKFASIFSVIDTNGDGVLNSLELQLGLQQMGVDGQDAADVAQALDYNHDGTCEFLEFAAASLSSLGSEFDDLLRQEWMALDAFGDGTGRLKGTSFKRLVDKLIPICTQRNLSVDDFVKDFGGTDGLTFDQFSHALGGGATPEVAVASAPAAPSTVEQSSEQEADETIQYYSRSHGRWVDTKVLSRRSDGAVQLAIKPGYWMEAPEQSQTLRGAADGKPYTSGGDGPTAKQTLAKAAVKAKSVVKAKSQAQAQATAPKAKVKAKAAVRPVSARGSSRPASKENRTAANVVDSVPKESITANGANNELNADDISYMCAMDDILPFVPRAGKTFGNFAFGPAGAPSAPLDDKPQCVVPPPPDQAENGKQTSPNTGATATLPVSPAPKSNAEKRPSVLATATPPVSPAPKSNAEKRPSVLATATPPVSPAPKSYTEKRPSVLVKKAMPKPPPSARAQAKMSPQASPKDVVKISRHASPTEGSSEDGKVNTLDTFEPVSPRTPADLNINVRNASKDSDPSDPRKAASKFSSDPSAAATFTGGKITGPQNFDAEKNEAALQLALQAAKDFKPTFKVEEKSKPLISKSLLGSLTNSLIGANSKKPNAEDVAREWNDFCRRYIGNPEDVEIKPQSGGRPIIIIDWDDTICPTTFIHREVMGGAPLHTLVEVHRQSKYYDDFVHYTYLVEAALRSAKKVAHVAVLTLASRWWIDSSLDKYFFDVNMRGLLKELDIEVFHADLEAPNVQANSHRADPRLVGKRTAFSTCLKRFYGTDNVLWNVMSVGDAMVEHDALKAVLAVEGNSENSKISGSPLCKTVKFIQEPTMEDTCRELESFLATVEAMTFCDRSFHRVLV